MEGDDQRRGDHRRCRFAAGAHRRRCDSSPLRIVERRRGEGPRLPEFGGDILSGLARVSAEVVGVGQW